MRSWHISYRVTPADRSAHDYRVTPAALLARGTTPGRAEPPLRRQRRATRQERAAGDRIAPPGVWGPDHGRSPLRVTCRGSRLGTCSGRRFDVERLHNVHFRFWQSTA